MPQLTQDLKFLQRRQLSSGGYSNFAVSAEPHAADCGHVTEHWYCQVCRTQHPFLTCQVLMAVAVCREHGGSMPHQSIFKEPWIKQLKRKVKTFTPDSFPLLSSPRHDTLACFGMYCLSLLSPGSHKVFRKAKMFLKQRATHKLPLECLGVVWTRLRRPTRFLRAS